MDFKLILILTNFSMSKRIKEIMRLAGATEEQKRNPSISYLDDLVSTGYLNTYLRNA